MVSENDDWVKQLARARRAREVPAQQSAEKAAEAEAVRVAAVQRFWAPICTALEALTDTYNAAYGASAITRYRGGASNWSFHASTAQGSVHVRIDMTSFTLSIERSSLTTPKPIEETWRLRSTDAGIVAAGLPGDPPTIARALLEEWLKAL